MTIRSPFRTTAANRVSSDAEGRDIPCRPARLRPARIPRAARRAVEKVDPALGLRGGERGEERVRDDRRVGVLAAVPRPGIVGLEVVADPSRRGQEAILLLMKRLVSFRQQPVDLARRNIDPKVQQLLADQRLGDQVLVVLIEDVAPQRRAKMPLDIRGQRGRSARAVGQQVAKTPIADVVRLDSQILDYEVLVAVLQRAFGKPFQRQRNGLVNDQFGCLLPFGRAWPFSATLFLVSGIWVRLVQSARPDRWPRRQAFQARDLRAQSLDLRLLLGNHPQQGLHQRRPLLRRHLDSGNCDRLGSIHVPQETPKPPSK
ncbi:MAG: hypothetical protein ACOX1P_27830 [Thermoguttaceae bacterium]